ncbi:MAG: hypothetical protein QOG53_3068 [Frankiales bacterium]|jgi:lysylphosphatidylglycerol synthetase-like protein (DUF2156 family)|nr:hypothetical protein [Frankiales bacterium]
MYPDDGDDHHLDPVSRTGVLVERLRTAEPRMLLAAALALTGIYLTARGLRESTHELAAVGAAGLLAARGIARARPLSTRHIVLAALCVIAARFLYLDHHFTLAMVATVLAGASPVLPLPPPPPGTPLERRHVWALVDGTSRDALAPFALRSDKAYVFSPNGLAAVAYRVRFGTAVASADPIGDPASRDAAIAEFIAAAEANGWRPAVLGSAESQLHRWQAHGLRAVPIGREVIIDVGTFALTGRRFRNLRQAVQRTHNFGVTTEVLVEASLSPTQRAELEDVVRRSRGTTQPRGFAMILDQVLTGMHPGVFINVARDRDGCVVAVQRVASADAGRELSMDVTWRLPDAPNGTEERLTTDVIAWAREHGAERVSLAFAAFPELFAMTHRNPLQQLTYWTVRRLDRFVKLESLYRYLRKFHSFGARRYVALRPLDVVIVAASLLTLEFGPVRTSRRGWDRLRGKRSVHTAVDD